MCILEVFTAVFDIHFMVHYWTFKCLQLGADLAQPCSCSMAPSRLPPPFVVPWRCSLLPPLSMSCWHDRRKGDRWGKSDPFAVMLVDNVEVGRTSVQQKTLNPTWGASGVFPVHRIHRDSADLLVRPVWLSSSALSPRCPPLPAVSAFSLSSIGIVLL